MKRFKSFSNPTSFGLVSIVALTACVSLSASDIDEFTAYRFYSPNKVVARRVKDVPSLVEEIRSDEEGPTERVAIDTGNSTTAKKIFGMYCTNGKQTRKLNVPLRAVLPAVGKGLVIDQASAFEARFRLIAQSRVASFFKDSASTPGQFNRYDFAYGKSDRVHTEANGFGGSEFSTFSGLSETAKEGSGPDAIMFPSDPKIYLTFGNVDQLSRPKKRAEIYKDLATSVFGVVTSRIIKAYEIDSSKGDYSRYTKQVTRNVVQPLRLLETFFFPNYFTMLIPEKEQVGIWRGHPKLTFFTKGRSFDLSQAVHDRHQLWNAYLESFVTVKEAQTDDPRVIDYEASLDLKLLCAYGRPVSDFISK